MGCAELSAIAQREVEQKIARVPPDDGTDPNGFATADPSSGPHLDIAADLVIPSTRLTPRRLPSTIVERADIVRSIRRRIDARVVRVCAPAGWGKTTLLTQLRAAELDDPGGRETCWLTVDGSDHTVEHFLAALVEACADGIADFELRWRDVVPAPGADPIGSVIPVVVDEVSVTADRALILLDDLHLATPASLEAITYLLQLLPSNAQLGYSTTRRLPLHVASLSVLGDVAELGALQLRLQPAEAQQMARSCGIELGDAAADLLITRTEGWPAGVAAAVQMMGATLAAGGQEADAVASQVVEGLSGRDRVIAELLHEQVIRELDQAELKMLLCASLLEDVDGRLVDALAGSVDASDRLQVLAASGGFITAADARGHSYRMHGLFREALRSLLEETTPPEQVRELHRRAALELERAGDVPGAIAHAIQAEQPELGADALTAQLPHLIGEPDLATLRAGVDALRACGDIIHAPLELSAALLDGLTGALARAAASLHAAEGAGWSGPVPGGWASLDGAVAIIAGSFLDTDVAIDRIVDAARATPSGSPWTSLAQYAAGRRSYLSGDLDTAREWFQLPTAAVERVGVDAGSGERLVAALASSYLAIIATDERRPARAEAALARASGWLGDGWHDLEVTAPLHLAQGVIEIAANRPIEAEQALAAARRLARESGAMQLHAVLELTRAAELRGNLDDARQYLAEAEGIAPELADCELLQKRLVAFVRLLHPASLSQAALIAPITAGEMAVLRRLPTDQTQVEIAEALQLSINTVKSHLRSIYQKLGVSSRPAALRRARALGLLLHDTPADDSDEPPSPPYGGGASPGSPG